MALEQPFWFKISDLFSQTLSDTSSTRKGKGKAKATDLDHNGISLMDVIDKGQQELNNTLREFHTLLASLKASPGELAHFK